MQPNRKNDTDNFPPTKRDDFDAQEISDQSVNQMSDEILRQMRRGDESAGGKEKADDRDIVGGSATIDTPEGRERAKVKDKKI